MVKLTTKQKLIVVAALVACPAIAAAQAVFVLWLAAQVGPAWAIAAYAGVMFGAGLGSLAHTWWTIRREERRWETALQGWHTVEPSDHVPGEPLRARTTGKEAVI